MFCIKIESNSQKTYFSIVLCTNMAAVTSGENHLFFNAKKIKEKPMLTECPMSTCPEKITLLGGDLKAFGPRKRSQFSFLSESIWENSQNETELENDWDVLAKIPSRVLFCSPYLMIKEHTPEGVIYVQLMRPFGLYTSFISRQQDGRNLIM